MKLIFSIFFLFFELFCCQQWLLWYLFYHGIKVIITWPNFIFSSYLVIITQGEEWALFFCIDCWLKYCFFNYDINKIFEETQEVESLSSSTCSQTTQGGTTRMGIACRTKATSQNIVIMLVERDTTNISKIYHLKGASNYGVGTSCQTHVLKGWLIYLLCDTSFFPHVCNKNNCKV